jgi:hypothetical protein
MRFAPACLEVDLKTTAHTPQLAAIGLFIRQLSH